VPVQVQDVGASTALSKAYGLKGKISLQHDEIIVPVTVVRDITAEVKAAEAAAPPITPISGGGSKGFTTVGEVCFWGLRNPASSGVLITVEKFRWRYEDRSTEVAYTPEVTVMLDTIGVAFGAQSHRDLRDISFLAPKGLLVADEVTVAVFAAAKVITQYEMEAFALGDFQPNKPGPEGYWEDDESYIIPPGRQLVVSDETPLAGNLKGVTMWWWWTEQAL